MRALLLADITANGDGTTTTTIFEAVIPEGASPRGRIFGERINSSDNGWQFDQDFGAVVEGRVSPNGLWSQIHSKDDSVLYLLSDAPDNNVRERLDNAPIYPDRTDSLVFPPRVRLSIDQSATYVDASLSPGELIYRVWLVLE